MKTKTFGILTCTVLTLLTGCWLPVATRAQATSHGTGQTHHYPLKELLEKGELDKQSKILEPLEEDGRQGVLCDGIVWLKGVRFSTGSIEIDLKGKDELQKSFLGVVFHGVDTNTYDIVYFRPFNFRNPDSVRRIHAVQYCSMPQYTWDRLRAEHNAQYEKAILPPPPAEEWFHARIDVDREGVVRVYVNYATTPSLVVHKLNARKDGLVGIWSTNYGVLGKFANMTIRE